MSERDVYIGLGANLGDRLGTLQAAVDRLARLGAVIAVSPVFETEPVGYADQPSFLNAVALVRTAQDADAVVSALLGIEAELGRVRTFANAPRVIDLDLLVLGEVRQATEVAVVPHPRLTERGFVLAPLAAIAPELVIPGQADDVAALLARLPAETGVAATALPLVAPVADPGVVEKPAT